MKRRAGSSLGVINMRFSVELAGVPIGATDLEPRDRAIGVFEPSAGYHACRLVFAEGGNALWSLLARPRQSPRGRRWRLRLVERMRRRAQALAIRTPSGMAVSGARVFLFDCARLGRPPIVIVHFDEAPAGSLAFTVSAAPPRVANGGRTAA
jgi:hypothetical protein